MGKIEDKRASERNAEIEGVRKNKRLKSCSGVRQTDHNCCANCKYLKPITGFEICSRDGGPMFLPSHPGALTTVCDGYVYSGVDFIVM